MKAQKVAEIVSSKISSILIATAIQFGIFFLKKICCFACLTVQSISIGEI